LYRLFQKLGLATCLVESTIGAPSKGAAANNNKEDSDSDCILLLEHAPVYTLGRGSDENYLTFLKDEADEIRNKLSWKARGPGSARLSIDRQVDNAVIAELPMNQAVDRLCQLGGTPVIAPNNVPIYQVERGGEVTFQGPCQLVVYPLLDLRRPPYQQDLHWYLRMVEEVVIQTLQHYNIESVRDEENTGNMKRAGRICTSVLSECCTVQSLTLVYYVHIYIYICILSFRNSFRIQAFGWVTIR
jgi:lipoate-protein ligase B